MVFDGENDKYIVIGYVDHDRLICIVVGTTVTLIIRVPSFAVEPTATQINKYPKRKSNFSVYAALPMAKTANVATINTANSTTYKLQNFHCQH